MTLEQQYMERFDLAMRMILAKDWCGTIYPTNGRYMIKWRLSDMENFGSFSISEKELRNPTSPWTEVMRICNSLELIAEMENNNA